LCEYLRIATVHPTPDYPACVAFLRQQAAEIGLDVEEFAARPPLRNSHE
jgi:hypothetical protein